MNEPATTRLRDHFCTIIEIDRHLVRNTQLLHANHSIGEFDVTVCPTNGLNGSVDYPSQHGLGEDKLG